LRGRAPDAKAAVAAPVLAKLPRKTITRLVQFIRDERRDLPPPNYATTIMDARLFWREIPYRLSHLHGSDDPGAKALEQAMEAWDEHIGPVYAQWLEAGSPKDSDGWYHRLVAPCVEAAPLPTVPMAMPEPVTLPVAVSPLSEPDADEDEDGPDYDENFRPSAEGPIVVYGQPIWPQPGTQTYTFLHAFYAFHTWKHFDGVLTRFMPDPRVRVHYVRTPIIWMFRNSSAKLAAAWMAVTNAQKAYPDKEKDTFAPPKRLAGK
jgi:hypothetical protein